MNRKLRPRSRLWRWLTDTDIEVGATKPEPDVWRQRYSIIGRFQARYLFLLLLFGVFFIALDQQVAGSPGCLQPSSMVGSSSDNCSINVPLIDLRLSVVYVWIWGAPVLLILLLAVMGSLRAALKAKVLSGLSQIEPFDEHPNLIDMAVYSYPDASGPMRLIGVLSYLLYLTSFWVEAVYLEARLLSSRPDGRLSAIALAIAVVLTAVSIPPLFKMWFKRLHGFFTRSG